MQELHRKPLFVRKVMISLYVKTFPVVASQDEDNTEEIEVMFRPRRAKDSSMFRPRRAEDSSKDLLVASIVQRPLMSMQNPHHCHSSCFSSGRFFNFY
jgi:hypothetical protein